MVAASVITVWAGTGGTTASGSPVAAPVASAARALGSAVADASVGSHGSYYQPAPATGSALAAPGRVIDSGRDAPDAFMFVQGGEYYLYTSQGNLTQDNVPVVVGTSVGHWGRLRDALPILPAWVHPGFTWAPDVHRFGNTYVLYFTSDVAGVTPPEECIGDATGSSPVGPFTAVDHPFICQLSQHGSIDPRTFTDTDGQNYMIWKSDENADVNGTADTNIYSQPLSANGLQLLGQPTRIFGPDEPWQGRIVEAPDMVQVDGAYWLFYSGGWFNQPSYAIGTARCLSPLGPCTDTSPGPWFASNSQGAGPGEESVFRDRTGVWMLYAPWRSNDPRPTPPRPVEMVRIGFGPTVPYVAAPDAPPGAGGPSGPVGAT
jgi:hypothetical protein